MTTISYSIIIPVYNRPIELKELLESLTMQTFEGPFEVIVVEDGSKVDSEKVALQFSDTLSINYFFKENSGPGLSRNFGMEKATGNYFIILDSDCILPSKYLSEVDAVLKRNCTDVYGGADASHASFSIIQKAINYSMTSVLTTGGIRGNKNAKSKFQPRSFNMGISKAAFEKTKGFGKQRFGEDIDLSFRLWQGGFESQFIEEAYVYHKRRTNWNSFFKQTFNFGAARPILNKQHIHTSKITYWFPSVFVLGLFLSVSFSILGRYELLFLYIFYFGCILIHSLFMNKSISVAIVSVFSTLVQFLGYGTGFLRSFYRINILKKTLPETFPRMFS